MATTSLIEEILSYKKNEISLEKKTALITGASSGIGLATSVYLAREGVNLILVARREQQLVQLKHELAIAFPHVRVNVLALNLAQKNITEQLKQFDSLNVDIFINNAGLARTRDFVPDLQEEDIDEVVDINIKAAFKISAAVAKSMVKNGSGHIVHLGSIAAHHTYEGGSVYCATKFALRAFSQTMRQELFDKNVRVSFISPGLVQTEFSEVRFKGDKEKADKIYEGVDCLRAPDIARVIVKALKEPSHVNLDEIVILPTVQSPVTYKMKRG
ncbi:MAG: SDR family NAD(P)-dependent oxidoreductase [Bdellovibrionota bacterium]